MASGTPKTLVSTSLFRAAIGPSSPEPLSLLPPIPSEVPCSNVIPRTRFLVDAFLHAGDHSISYFLSHFHSDHYTGLTPNWSKGIIFCSYITSRLLVEVLKVPESFVVSLSLGEVVFIDGCDVTLVDANHCPGSVQFLFKVPVHDSKFERYVYTGDFRLCDSMKAEPFLKEFVGCEAIFLDTTYCNPKFVFPSQEDSIDYIVSVIEKFGGDRGASKGKVLFLVATYVIGKERILVEVARRCSRKVHVDSRKMLILRILGYGMSGLFTEDASESSIHVVGWNTLGNTWPYFRPDFIKMREIMLERGYDKVVGFVPTGWTYEVKRNKFMVKTKESFEIHLVPYSEHSNYCELQEFVKFLKPRSIVPTVSADVDSLDSKHLQSMQKHFAGLVDETSSKRDVLMNSRRFSSELDEMIEAGSPQEIRATTSIDASGNSCTTPVFDDLSIRVEKSSQSPLVNREAKEEALQELGVYLPAWVSRDQMLELINASGNDIIEAVSSFYERETDFFRQVSTSTSLSDVSASLITSSAVSLSVSTPANNNSARTMNLFSSIQNKVTKTNHVKKSSNPGKKPKTVSVNSKKKRKIGSTPETLNSGSGSRQSTITSFFTKKLPVSPHGCGVGNRDSPKH
ncbi:hypothetical protein SAY86_005581 [Trapa natans]|uniref:DNA repair metallo-beta-lactamase domain-containing protein n=1 Tax=Trapa natans TaxID=22666 RepID=A0AAN7KV43_TRANT|nr:hypothetical protein SAY86_005581 [Trapa natans]